MNAEFYDNQSGYYEKEPRGKRRGAGGYILTAVIAFLVGVLLTSIFFVSSNGLIDDSALLPQATPTEKPVDEAAEAETPKLTPLPAETTRPEIEFDGTAPDVGNVPSVFAAENPLPDIIEQVMPGVVGIVNYQYSREYGKDVEMGSGSGFIISSDGYIVTNYHVAEDASALTVLLSDGTEADAQLVGVDKTTDIAVLKIGKSGLAVLKPGDSKNVRVGDFVIAIGDPTGRELAGTATFGIISATARNMTIDGLNNDYLQMDAAVNPGNSGGPLLNMAGEVIGITSAKTVTASYDEYGNGITAEGLGFALPINEAMEIVQQLIAKGYIQRPGIGISVVTMDEDSAAEYGVPAGVAVYSVTKGGPGDKAGLKPNDIVLQCDGLVLTEQDAFVDYVKSKKVGDTIQLKVWRDGSELELSLTLEDLNEMGSELTEDSTADFKFAE